MRTVQMTLDDDLVDELDQMVKEVKPIVRRLRARLYAKHWRITISKN